MALANPSLGIVSHQKISTTGLLRLRTKDVFAFAVRLCILSTIIAASRDAFAHVKSGRTRLLTSIVRNWGTPVLKSSPLLFLWMNYHHSLSDRIAG